MVRIEYSPVFVKRYRRLSQELQRASEEKEALFRENPFDPRLKTHKLGGEWEGYWAFSIDYHYRIIFAFLENDAVRFHLVGTHDIYK